MQLIATYRDGGSKLFKFKNQYYFLNQNDSSEDFGKWFEQDMFKNRTLIVDESLINVLNLACNK